MRILADENCPGDLVDALRTVGHDVAWVHIVAPGAPDPAILAQAQHEQRLVLTFDKDFGELAFRHRLPAQHGIILCRLPGLRPALLIAHVLQALANRADWSGHFTVLTQQQIRMIPLPPS
jgi:predicted nuclease of predicted toxin-antitoxin system